MTRRENAALALAVLLGLLLGFVTAPYGLVPR